MKNYIIVAMFLSMTVSIRAMQKDCIDQMFHLSLQVQLTTLNCAAIASDITLDAYLYHASKKHPELLKHSKNLNKIASMVPICSLSAIAAVTQKSYVFAFLYTGLGLKNLQLRSQEIDSDIRRLERLQLKNNKT